MRRRFLVCAGGSGSAAYDGSPEWLMEPDHLSVLDRPSCEPGARRCGFRFLLDSQAQFCGLSLPTLQKRIGMWNVGSVFQADPHFDLLPCSRARHPATLIRAMGITASRSGLPQQQPRPTTPLPSRPWPGVGSGPICIWSGRMMQAVKRKAMGPRAGPDLAA